MTIDEQTLSLPNGARFYRCALQVNPYDYLARHSKATIYEGEPAYNDALVDACLAQGVHAIGVTDHYRIKTARGLIEKARGAGLVVFPGFEAVSKEGAHFLCLFDPATDEEQIERRIGECRVAGDEESPVGQHDALELMQACADWRAICIAAHVAAPGGLLKTLSGQSAINAWRSPNLLACALPGPIGDAPANLRPIIENSNPDYRRDRPVAVINAKDVNDPADIGRPGSVTAIKMSQPDYEGLNQAILDPASRIRLASDPEPEEHTEFIAIEWAGGFLDGAAIHFNENLNVLVGGRGTGKSTVIESIRAVLGLTPVGEQAGKEHEGLVKHVLRSGTQISLLLKSPHPSPREYLIERSLPNAPVVKTREGDTLALSPVDVAPRVEVFGQHEISELARNPQERTRLLGRFLEADGHEAAKEAAARLEPARRALLETLANEIEIEERLAALPSLTETLKRYQEAGLEDKLKHKSLLVREERVLDAADESIGELRDLVDAVRAALPIEREFLEQGELDELPNSGLLQRLGRILEELSDATSRAVDSLDDALASAASDSADVRADWRTKSDEADEVYQRALRELQRDNVDGEEFIRLRRQIERLGPLKQRRAQLQSDIATARQQRRSAVIAYEEAKAVGFRALERAAKKVTRRLAGRVRVTVTFQGDREPLAELLRGEVGGRLSETIDALARATDLSLRGLADACRAGPAELTDKFGIPAPQASRLAEAGEETFMAIEELDLPSTTELELNVAPAGKPEAWQALDDLSAGQKATAVLLLLLLESDAPLVIDQPEDDLDNRFITEGVVPKMRDEKRRRQFIFSTHNANIPVLGDAELIAGLEASGEGGQGQATIPVQHMGSIDVPAVRELVEELLEGGKEAFELRRLKYGF